MLAELSAANSIREMLTQMYVNLLSDFLQSSPLAEAKGISDIFNVASAASALTTVTPMLVGAIWSSGKLTAVQNAYKHWKKHRHDFPNIPNAKKFADFADDFVKNPPGTALVKTRSNGDTVIYDPASDLFAVATSSGTPRTVYKPDPSMHGHPTNLDYFNAQ
jgi:filamentous hemagglutinin